MTRLSIAIPDSESWIVKALETARAVGSQSGPTPSIGSIVREILAEHLSMYRPPDPEELEVAAKAAAGYCFDYNPY